MGSLVMLLTKAQQKKLQVTWNTITSVMNSFEYKIPEDYQKIDSAYLGLGYYYAKMCTASDSVQAVMPQELKTLVKTVLYQNLYDCFKDVKTVNNILLYSMEKILKIIKLKEHSVTTLYPPPHIEMSVPKDYQGVDIKYKNESVAYISYSEESGFKWHWEHVKRTTDTLIKLAYIINNYGTIHGVECLEKPEDFIGKWTGIPTQYTEVLKPEEFLKRLCYLKHYCKKNNVDFNSLDIRDIKG